MKEMRDVLKEEMGKIRADIAELKNIPKMIEKVIENQKQSE